MARSFPTLRAVAGVAVLALVAVGCGGDDDAGTADTTTSSAAPPEEAEVTSSPARDRVDWFLDQVNGGALDAATLADGFTAEFLAEVPADALAATTAEAFGIGTDWEVGDDSGLGELDGQVVLRSAEGHELVMALVVEPAEPHLIAGALLQPQIPEVFPEGEDVTFDDVDAALEPLAPVVSYGVFDVAGGQCRALHELNGEEALPVGSAFKLWILIALAEEVEAGTMAWDDVLPVDDALKSSTDGEISSLDAGTEVTLRRHAELMIAISDNSATDHLLHHLGRERVEGAMSAVVDRADLNVPMLSTRELFLLKWGTSVPAEEYLALDADGRRTVLDERLAGVGLLDELDPTWAPDAPAHVTELEWFATSTDMCRTHLRLAELAERQGLEPVAGILSANPGLPFPAEWTDVRFKGGSEPGVAYGSWLLADDAGRTIVVTGGAVDPEATVDELRVLVTVTGAARAVG